MFWHEKAKFPDGKCGHLIQKLDGIYLEVRMHVRAEIDADQLRTNPDSLLYFKLYAF